MEGVSKGIGGCVLLYLLARCYSRLSVTSEKIAQKLAIERTKEMYKAIKRTCKACENERLVTFLSPSSCCFFLFHLFLGCVVFV